VKVGNPESAVVQGTAPACRKVILYYKIMLSRLASRSCK